MTNMKVIQTVTVGAGGAANIDFTSIPQTYTDLQLVLSLRFTSAVTDDWGKVIFNNSAGASAYNSIYLRGDGSTGSTGSGLDNYFRATIANGDSTLASTFASNVIYIPNYTSSSINKIATSEGTYENNVTTNYMMLVANLWSVSNAINQITITPVTGNWAQHTTATLYGISNTIASGAKAYGGYVTEDSNYFYHTFLSSGTFTPTQSISADCLVIAGGGGSGADRGGGGGAGGLKVYTSQSLTATDYAVTVGGGGAGGSYTSEGSSANTKGSNGSNSQFGSLTASTGGGGGGACSTGSNINGANGGSGGGAGFASGSSGTIGTGTSGEGSNGGTGIDGGGSAGGGGGGGATAAGSNATISPKTSGAGGAGSSAYSSWGSATSTGQNINGTYWYAGGGAGGAAVDLSTSAASGGNGGGGAGSASNLGIAGTANTGGGAGGGFKNAGSAGGSGIVIIRYAK